MKITEEVRKYAAEQGIAEEEALERGMEEKLKEFVQKGAEVANSPLFLLVDMKCFFGLCF